MLGEVSWIIQFFVQLYTKRVYILQNLQINSWQLEFKLNTYWLITWSAHLYIWGNIKFNQATHTSQLWGSNLAS